MGRPTSGGCVVEYTARGKRFFTAQIQFQGKRYRKSGKERAAVESWLEGKRREFGLAPAIQPLRTTAIRARAPLPGSLRGWGAIARW
jgi:hypothetical protein